MRDLPTPEATSTFQPVPHGKFVEAIIESLAYRKIEVVKDEYAVTHDAQRLFGLLELNIEEAGITLALGIRNSHDKSMRLALTAGYRVFVCSNMAFRGDFTPVMRKHSKNMKLVEMVSIGVDSVQRQFQPMVEEVNAWRGFELSDRDAKVVLADAFIGRQLRAPKYLAERVFRYYFCPTIEEFKPRTMWSLSNAFTHAFKGLDAAHQFEATASLSKFLAGYNISDN